MCNQAYQAVNELGPSLQFSNFITLLTGPSIHDCQTALQSVIMHVLENLTRALSLLKRKVILD